MREVLESVGLTLFSPDRHRRQVGVLYVNRGYGYLGFPGRVGMPPEITLITLKKGTAPA